MIETNRKVIINVSESDMNLMKTYSEEYDRKWQHYIKLYENTLCVIPIVLLMNCIIMLISCYSEKTLPTMFIVILTFIIIECAITSFVMSSKYKKLASESAWNSTVVYGMLYSDIKELIEHEMDISFFVDGNNGIIEYYYVGCEIPRKLFVKNMIPADVDVEIEILEYNGVHGWFAKESA